MIKRCQCSYFTWEHHCWLFRAHQKSINNVHMPIESCFYTIIIINTVFLLPGLPLYCPSVLSMHFKQEMIENLIPKNEFHAVLAIILFTVHVDGYIINNTAWQISGT